MIRMQIQFTEQQARTLRRVAARQGISQSEVVRQALDAQLGARSEPDRATLRIRAQSAVGAFPGAETDVAGRHDDYLADSIADWKRDDRPQE